MSVYLLVGAGRMAQAVVSYLVKDPETEEVYILDKRDSATVDLVERADSPKVMAFTGIKEQAVSAIEGLKVCIATCGYQEYVRLTKDCIASRVGMVDLGGNREVVEEQMALNVDAKLARCTIVPDCGLAPGLVNILGMHAFEQLEAYKCKDIEIKMRVGGLPAKIPYGNPTGYQMVWSADGLINEYITPSEELMGGKLLKENPLEWIETFHYNGQEFEAFTTGGGSSNLPRLLQGRAETVTYKTIRYPGHCKQMQTLAFLGLFEGEARVLLTKHMEKAFKMPDYDPDQVIGIVEATGRDQNKALIRIRYELDVQGSAGIMSAMAKTTGYSAAIVAKMIANGTISKTGVVEGEVAVPGKAFLKALNDCGLEVSSA